MERRDWLLLLVGLNVSDNKVPPAIDPLRIMKALFLFTMREPPASKGLYEFVPYMYGPCSFEVYGDLDALKVEGYVTEEPIPGYTWGAYSVTSKGQERMQRVLLEVSSELVDKLKRIKAEVLSLSFLNLLKRVYQEFPHYAANSIVTFGQRQ